MSLAINPDFVVAILLADGWHDVTMGSFYLDSFEFVYPDSDTGRMDIAHGGGNSGICATGFRAKVIYDDEDPRSDLAPDVVGPLTSILAVRSE